MRPPSATGPPFVYLLLPPLPFFLYPSVHHLTNSSCLDLQGVEEREGELDKLKPRAAEQGERRGRDVGGAPRGASRQPYADPSGVQIPIRRYNSAPYIHMSKRDRKRRNFGLKSSRF